MSKLTGLLLEPGLELESAPPVSPDASQDVVPGLSNSQQDEQIQSLVEQLFLQREARARHVGFTALEPGAGVGPLCLQVARALADSGGKDVGLIDAQFGPAVSLQDQIQLQSPHDEDAHFSIAPRLWLVTRRRWFDASSPQIWDSSFARLRASALEFDYSIVCFDSVSWVTARISHVCDGLVLVVSANKTRRLVAAQIRDQLRKARVPLLGAVLAERRLPVPEGLYRNL